MHSSWLLDCILSGTETYLKRGIDGYFEKREIYGLLSRNEFLLGILLACKFKPPRSWAKAKEILAEAIHGHDFPSLKHDDLRLIVESFIDEGGDVLLRFLVCKVIHYRTLREEGTLDLMRHWTSSSEVDKLRDSEEVSTTEVHAILSEKEFLPDLMAYWERVNSDSANTFDI